MEKGIGDYFMGDYLGSVENLQKAVALGLRRNYDISKAYRFLPYSYVALNERNKAKASFRKALKADLELALDPVYVSPKSLKFFRNSAKEGTERTNFSIYLPFHYSSIMYD